jgi:dihydrofolate reductase
MVIVGRRTVEDFPGQKPLPGRVNVVLTRKGGEIPGFTVTVWKQLLYRRDKWLSPQMKAMLTYLADIRLQGDIL